jgi:hypothetical protein
LQTNCLCQDDGDAKRDPPMSAASFAEEEGGLFDLEGRSINVRKNFGKLGLFLLEPYYRFWLLIDNKDQARENSTFYLF